MREMKDSGIEWIGEIPKDWIVTSFRAFVEERVERNKFNQTTELLSLSFALGVTLFKDKVYNKDRIKTNFEEYNIVHKDDLVLSPNDIIKGSIFVSKYYGCISPMYYVFSSRCKETHNLYYLSYLLRTKEAGRRFFFIARGLIGSILDNGKYVTRRMTVSRNDLMTFKVLLPSSKEQDRIVKFLDSKCSEIDATSEDIQKEINILEDYKKSVITEAVTKGLDPNVEMKDSGIKWLPKIPVHWQAIPSKYLFANSDVRRKIGDEQLTASQKYGIITQKEYTAKENAQVVLATQGLDKWKHVEPNDFIISLRSFQGGLEMSEITGCITWHYVVLKAQKEVCYKFYKWLFKSARYINALQGTCNFIRDGQDLRFSNFALVPLFELPLSEQQQIADYLDARCSEIDALIADKKKQLELLADYKKSLIYEYVTGKKEVPTQE